MNSEKSGYIQLILFSFFGGVLGIFVKLINNMDVYSIVFFRALIASIFIFIVILLRNRLKELSIVYPFRTLLVGVFQALSVTFYFLAIVNTSISNAIFLVYTAPIFSVIMARLFLKEEIERETIIGIAITLTGIAFILDPSTFSFASNQSLGNMLGLASGFFYSAMALTAKPIMRKKSAYYTAFWQYIAITIMFAFALKPDTAKIVVENWWQLIVIGVFCTGIAFILFMDGVKKVKAQKIFVITALEPLVGTVFALIILKEIPSLMAIMGAVLILYGVYRMTQKSNSEEVIQSDTSTSYN